MFYRLTQIMVCVWLSVFASSVLSAQTSELNETMKKIGFSYKQMLKAETIEQANIAIIDMEMMIDKSRKLGFKKEVEKQSLEGLDKVATKLKKVKKLLNQNELQQAKQAALEIDGLRKEYHKLHQPPSFWDLLFG